MSLIVLITKQSISEYETATFTSCLVIIISAPKVDEETARLQFVDTDASLIYTLSDNGISTVPLLT